MKSKFLKGTPIEMQQADKQRFFNSDPDGFSPERNKFIIEETIRKYEATRVKKVNDVVDHYSERADAVVSFIKSVDRGKGAQGNLEKYFGKQMLAYLRGQQIRDKLMNNMLVKDKAGNIVKRA